MKRYISILCIILAFFNALAARASAQQVIVCVLDSGCDAEGAEGWDFLSDTGDLSDPLRHGTQVYSLLTGIAPEVQVFMLKCFASDMTFDEGAVIRALYAAVDDYGADLINMSWTVNAERPALYDAIRYAYDRGVLLVAPVGNLSLSTGLGAMTYPAAWDEVIGIGGVNLNDEGEPVSSLYYLANESVFICARADCGGEKGSSYAAPRVSALIANYLGENPGASDEDVRSMLIEAARDVGEPGYDIVYGWGYVDPDMIKTFLVTR
jgi:subtilisin family serine protease